MKKDWGSFLLGNITGYSISYIKAIKPSTLPPPYVPIKNINAYIEDISTQFTLRTVPILTHPWSQITKSECPNQIKLVAYGVHSGVRGKYEKFLFWKVVTLTQGQTQLSFNFDIKETDDMMIEVMSYSKHKDLGDSYNVLEYYIVYTGGLV